MSFASTFKYGVPFLSFVVLGSFLLREFTSIRYEIHSYKRKYGTRRSGDDEEPQEVEVQKQEEEQIKALGKLGDNDDWKNIRGPRPWEDNRDFNQLIDSLKEKAKK
ncbi:Cytochrome oxidase assembly [Tyrophagus putrescentiae]|nr:Cytochrome oxidase assembly [Tyrophagus putrescentiae]